MYEMDLHKRWVRIDGQNISKGWIHTRDGYTDEVDTRTDGYAREIDMDESAIWMRHGYW